MGPVAGGAEPPAWAMCIAATRGAASIWMEPPCSLLPFTPRFFPLPSTVHSWAEELFAEVESLFVQFVPKGRVRPSTPLAAAGG